MQADVTKVNELLARIDSQLTQKEENLNFLTDLFESVKTLNLNLSEIEAKADLHPRLAETVLKISSVFHAVMGKTKIPSDDHDTLKCYSRELVQLDFHTTALHPGISGKWQPLIDILKTPHDQLQKRLDEIPNADKTTDAGKKNIWLNRYSNVFPYDSNRVEIDGNRYINASRFDLEGSRFLVGSAPIKDCMRNTVPDLWRMIVENDTRLIVAVTNTRDFRLPKSKKERQVASYSGVAGRLCIEKCYPYWHSHEVINEQMIAGWRCLSITDEEVIDSAGCQKIIQRVITLAGPNEEIREITHLQFLNWPDSGIADTKLAMKFCEKIKELDTQKTPPAVHCSAGIGRTGVTLAILLIMDQIQKSVSPEELQIDVMEVIKKLREQRPNMVQSAAQVKMIARVALEALLEAKKNLSKTVETTKLMKR
jgi:protein tyrosine phosphatase